jgi:hypothetical protein
MAGGVKAALMAAPVSGAAGSGDVHPAPIKGAAKSNNNMMRRVFRMFVLKSRHRPPAQSAAAVERRHYHPHT